LGRDVGVAVPGASGIVTAPLLVAYRDPAGTTGASIVASSRPSSSRSARVDPPAKNTSITSVGIDVCFDGTATR
jgi:hypothetical protein